MRNVVLFFCGHKKSKMFAVLFHSRILSFAELLLSIQLGILYDLFLRVKRQEKSASDYFESISLLLLVMNELIPSLSSCLISLFFVRSSFVKVLINVHNLLVSTVKSHVIIKSPRSVLNFQKVCLFKKFVRIILWSRIVHNFIFIVKWNETPPTKPHSFCIV